MHNCRYFNWPQLKCGVVFQLLGLIRHICFIGFFCGRLRWMIQLQPVCELVIVRLDFSLHFVLFVLLFALAVTLTYQQSKANGGSQHIVKYWRTHSLRPSPPRLDNLPSLPSTEEEGRVSYICAILSWNGVCVCVCARVHQHIWMCYFCSNNQYHMIFGCAVMRSLIPVSWYSAIFSLCFLVLFSALPPLFLNILSQSNLLFMSLRGCGLFFSEFVLWSTCSRGARWVVSVHPLLYPLFFAVWCGAYVIAFVVW